MSSHSRELKLGLLDTLIGVYLGDCHLLGLIYVVMVLQQQIVTCCCPIVMIKQIQLNRREIGYRERLGKREITFMS